MRHAIFTVTISTVSDTFLPLKSLFTFLPFYLFTSLPFYLLKEILTLGIA